MSIFSKRSAAAVGLLLAGAGVVTAAAAGGVPSTMPAANPKDAAAAKMYAVQQSIPASKLGGKANSYFYASNGGGQVKIAKVTEKGFTSYQTVTITPPNTSPATTILQGFATLSGGNTGSRLITSTSTRPKAFTIKLSNPGEQGIPGKLTFRVQLTTIG